jgi:RNA polymerase sigma-70 factor (ECF subfamily)
MSDAIDSLMDGVKRREPAALAEYLEAMRKPLLAFISHKFGSGLRRKLEAEDVFQEVSVEAIRALPDADLSERDPFRWLCQIAERKIIDAHRRFYGAQKRDAGRELALNAACGDGRTGEVIDLLVASMTTATQAFSRNQKEIRLIAALSALPAEQQQAIRLRYVEGLASKEIAEKLGKTDGAVRVMLTRSLAQLQKILDVDNP